MTDSPDPVGYTPPADPEAEQIFLDKPILIRYE